MLKLKGAPARITVTEHGRAIQREMVRAFLMNNSFQSNDSRAKDSSSSPQNFGEMGSLQRHTNPVVDRKNNILLSGEGLNLNSSRIQSSFRSKSRDENIKLPRIEFSQELDNNPFIKQKLDKMNEYISKFESRKDKSQNFADNLTYLASSENSYIQNNIHDQSITHQITVRNDMYDRVMVKNYAKWLHAESEAEMLLKRHESNIKKMQKIQTEVQKRCINQKKFKDEENHKPPALLDDIRENNPSAIEALQRETQAFKRKFRRIREKVKSKYEPTWNQFQDLSKKK